MEPCLFRHGKPEDPTKEEVEAAKLQWSHVFSDMVRDDFDDDRWCASSLLQWSHVFSDMVSDY